MSDNIADRIVRLYDADVSQKEIARMLKISYQTVRKTLCTAGRIETREMRMQADGMTPEKIAKELDKTVKAVNSRLPYTKGQYKGDTPTINALRIRACRDRKKERKEKP